ncbi:hypothetical protein GEMRC1_004604 [Eukaryota sp. GEM-RC1]
MGLSDHAANLMGDIVYVDLPEIGSSLQEQDSVCGIESVKSASDVYCPTNATVVDVNNAIVDDPSLINSSPYGQGWIVKLKGKLNKSELMTKEQYESFKAKSSH